MVFLAFLLTAQVEWRASASECPVYVVQRTKHIGLVLPVKDIQSEDWVLPAELRKYPYVEIGWGDEKIYRSQWNQQTLMLQLRAIALETDSVILQMGLAIIPEKVPFYQKVLTYRINRDELSKIHQFISATYQRDSSDHPILVQKNRSYPVLFHKAKGKYTAKNTCNTWTAEALTAGGILSKPARPPNTAKKLLKLLEVDS